MISSTPASQRSREAPDQRLRGRIDLADIVAFGRERGLGCIAQRARRQRLVGERETTAGETHAALEPRAALPRDQVRRHGVEHFVGDHQPAPARRKNLDPVDARQQRRRSLAQALALPRREIGAHFEQAIAPRQAILRDQRIQQIGGEPPGARPQLDQIAVRQSVDDVGGRRGQRGAEQRRQFGRGDEIAGGAELACARRVIAESRRIQRGAHVIGERDPAARLVDRCGNVRQDLFAVRACFVRRRRQSGSVIAVWSGGHRCDRLGDSSQCSRSAACRAKSS